VISFTLSYFGNFVGLFPFISRIERLYFKYFREEKQPKSFSSDLNSLFLPQEHMGGVDGGVGRVVRSNLRHDRHTGSLLTDHLVFSPKYRGDVLLGEVAKAAEEIIRKN